MYTGVSYYVGQRERRACQPNRPATLETQDRTQQPQPGPGIAAFRENRRQATAMQWRGYTV